MTILKQFNRIVALCFIPVILGLPGYSLDLDSTVNDASRTNYSRSTSSSQKIENVTPVNNQSVQKVNSVTNTDAKKLPDVPSLPKNVNSTTIAPYNGVYSGKVPDSNSYTPCNFVVDKLIIDDSVVKSKYKDTKSVASGKKTNSKQVKTSKAVLLSKGTQFRVFNKVQITDSMHEGNTIEFLSKQDFATPYYKIPKNTKFTARVVDSHKPQMTCNGGLVAIRFVSMNLNGKNLPINAGIIKIKTENIHFSNLKGEHTYWKTTCKKAKWGQKMFGKWSKTSSKLANKGACVLLAPFPYLGGCVLAVSSTVTSPVTALLGKGGNLVVPANTMFTIKLYDDVNIK